MKSAGSDPRQDIGSWVLLIVVFLVVFWVLIFAPPFRRHGPSLAQQRAEHRKIVFERVQSGGGWSELRRECEFLVTSTPRPGAFEWRPPATDAHVIQYSNSIPIADYTTNLVWGSLPPTIAGLQPEVIDCARTGGGAIVVRIKLFGLHRTGTWDISYYGLWVVCGTTNQDYSPEPNPPLHTGANKVADFIFEVYK